MIQKLPTELISKMPTDDYTIDEAPCSMVAISCMLADLGIKLTSEKIENSNFVVKNNSGYKTLRDMTKTLRVLMPKIKYHYFIKKDRLRLKQVPYVKDKSIICLRGHYIYAKDDVYYSFFDNIHDEVIAMWWLEEEKIEEKDKK